MGDRRSQEYAHLAEIVEPQPLAELRALIRVVSEELPFVGLEPHLAEIESIAECVRGGGQLPVGGIEGLSNIEVLRRIAEAGRSSPGRDKIAWGQEGHMRW
jgi:hypothetical protein